MKKVAILLAGCGVYDGSEIHEVVLLLLALSRHGVPFIGVAPNRAQHDVVNHLTQQETTGPRNILQESARIMRGNVVALSEVDVSDFSADIVPGGFGAAKNLSNYAFKGDDYMVSDDILTFLQNAKSADKPMGFACIAPVLAAKVFPEHTKMTIGNDASVAAVVEQCGMQHVETSVAEIVVDHENKLVTTPAYMLGQSVIDIQPGIDRLVDAVLKMA